MSRAELFYSDAGILAKASGGNLKGAGLQPTRPFSVQINRLVTLMTMMMSAMETEILKVRLLQMNAFVHPNVEGYNTLDYHKAEEILIIGEKAACRELPKIREILKPTSNVQLSTMNNDKRITNGKTQGLTRQAISDNTCSLRWTTLRTRVDANRA